MLADTGVAVNPNDERYKHLIGKEAIVPIVERRVPIVGDERVEMDFGTGALKITPGHDPMDFDIGKDHGLEELTVIGPDGRMNEAAGEFAGLTQEEANERIVARLREQGLLEQQEPYRHSVGHCDRCGARIEPLITLQWWVKMKPLAEPAAAAIRDGRVTFTPGAAERRRARLARQHPRLVHLAADLVGAPDPGVVLPRRAHDGRREHAGCVRGVRLDRDPPGRGRPRHVVLVGALAVRDARLARRRHPTSTTSIRTT